MLQISFRCEEKTWTFYLDEKRQVRDLIKYLGMDIGQINSLFALKRQCIINLDASFSENQLENNEIIKVRKNA